MPYNSVMFRAGPPLPVQNSMFSFFGSMPFRCFALPRFLPVCFGMCVAHPVAFLCNFVQSSVIPLASLRSP